MQIGFNAILQNNALHVSERRGIELARLSSYFGLIRAIDSIESELFR